MKKILLPLVFVTVLISFQCKKDNTPDNPPIPDIAQPKIISLNALFTYETYGFTEMKYKGNHFDYAMFDNTKIKFSYKNNRIDKYVGPMFGSCCDVRARKQYHYFNDSLIDHISFESTYKDDYLEYIKLKYNGANQINYYRLHHSLDPYPFYSYEWSGDDISKLTAYDFNWHVVPDSVIAFIDTYTYSNIINPLQSLNTIYFEYFFLNKHLPSSMTRIRYWYDTDNNTYPKTRSLTKIDTVYYNYSYDYSNSGLVTGIFRNSKKLYEIEYDK